MIDVSHLGTSRARCDSRPSRHHFPVPCRPHQALAQLAGDDQLRTRFDADLSGMGVIL